MSASAAAEVQIVPAASGHAALPLTGGDPVNLFHVENNKVCGKFPGQNTWDTPLMLPNFTGGLVDVYQYRGYTGSDTGTSYAKSNAYSVYPTGEIYEWSGSKTNNSFLGDVNVPTDGTLFADSIVSDEIFDNGKGCIYQFRAEW